MYDDIVQTDQKKLYTAAGTKYQANFSCFLGRFYNLYNTSWCRGKVATRVI